MRHGPSTPTSQPAWMVAALQHLAASGPTSAVNCVHFPAGPSMGQPSAMQPPFPRQAPKPRQNKPRPGSAKWPHSPALENEACPSLLHATPLQSRSPTKSSRRATGSNSLHPADQSPAMPTTGKVSHIFTAEVAGFTPVTFKRVPPGHAFRGRRRQPLGMRAEHWYNWGNDAGACLNRHRLDRWCCPPIPYFWTGHASCQTLRGTPTTPHHVLLASARSEGLAAAKQQWVMATAGYTGTQVHRYTGTQVHRYTGTQVRRYAGTQERRYAGTQVHRYAGTQVRRYAGTQVRRYAGTQVRRYAGTQVRRYAGTQVRKYASTQVRKYASTQILKYSNNQKLKYSNTQILKYSNTQTLKHTNTQTHQHTPTHQHTHTSTHHHTN